MFKNQTMDRETLEPSVETARFALTASNAQNLQWTVIEGRDKLESLAKKTINWMERVIEAQLGSPSADYFRPVVAGWATGYDGILRGAQTLIVPSASKENAYGLVNLSIALAYLELAALLLGVGICWTRLLRGAVPAPLSWRNSWAYPRATPGFTH